MINHFDPEKFYDHRIVDGQGNVVGHIRVKPSGVLWAPKNGKKWHGVSLSEFAAFMEANGTMQKK
jgi:hypothetical protein